MSPVYTSQVVIQMHLPGPDSGPRTCQNSGKKMNPFILSVCWVSHCVPSTWEHSCDNIQVSEQPWAECSIGWEERELHGESKEEIWMSGGSPAGTKKSKGPGEGSCVCVKSLWLLSGGNRLGAGQRWMQENRFRGYFVGSRGWIPRYI